MMVLLDLWENIKFRTRIWSMKKGLILSCSATPKCKIEPDQGQRVHFDQKQINPVKGMRTSDQNITCLKHPLKKKNWNKNSSD